MKLLLLLTCSTFTYVAASCQVVLKDTIQAVIWPHTTLVIDGIFLKNNKATIDSLPAILRQRIASTSKIGIYVLPQDNMPCIVPDTREIAAIPNLWKGEVKLPFKSKIPNPLPYRWYENQNGKE